MSFIADQTIQSSIGKFHFNLPLTYFKLYTKYKYWSFPYFHNIIVSKINIGNFIGFL